MVPLASAGAQKPARVQPSPKPAHGSGCCSAADSMTCRNLQAPSPPTTAVNRASVDSDSVTRQDGSTVPAVSLPNRDLLVTLLRSTASRADKRRRRTYGVSQPADCADAVGTFIDAKARCDSASRFARFCAGGVSFAVEKNARKEGGMSCTSTTPKSVGYDALPWALASVNEFAQERRHPRRRAVAGREAVGGAE